MAEDKPIKIKKNFDPKKYVDINPNYDSNNMSEHKSILSFKEYYTLKEK
jgi:hypothetical protein